MSRKFRSAEDRSREFSLACPSRLYISELLGGFVAVRLAHDSHERVLADCLVRSTIQIRVRFAETDTAGIVHYAQYLAYLETGRAEALRAVGLSGDMVAACRLHSPVLEALLRYRAPARFDDLLDVTTWIIDISDSRIRWAYEIRRTSDQVVVATAETQHGSTESWPPDGAQRQNSLAAALERLGDST